ncbi:MAG: MFS transporter [Myxococcales bacterium]|nr:MFS transporter [Myxococcales bacterium]MCB9668527.1 MFS transporter [Alphaproteobacteria bacterium]MCB9690768.1 MFS transporter [Alphaproteobacteria bacterium]
MTPQKPRIAPVLLTVALDLVGFGIVIPLLSFYAESFGAGALQVTLLMAVYSVAQFVMTPVWGRLSDTHGRRPVLLFSIGTTAAMLTLFAFAPSLWVLFLARALHGAAAANISTAQAYVADVTTPADRAKGMGLVGASIGLGFTVGPWLGGELAGFGHRVPILVAAGLSLLNLAWVAARLPESRQPGAASDAHRRTLDPRSLLAGLTHPVVGLAILLTFVAVFAFAMMESTIALVAEHRWTWDEADVGRMLGVVGIIGIIVQGGLLGRLARRFGEPILVSAGYLSMGLGFALLSVASGAELWLGVVLLALGNSLAVPSLNALISRATDASEQGRVLGVNQSMSALARAIGPATGGVLYTQWFDGGALAAASVMMFAALALSVPATRRARSSHA